MFYNECRFYKITTAILFITLLVCVLALANNPYLGQIKNLFLATQSNQNIKSLVPDLAKYQLLASKACLSQTKINSSSTPNYSLDITNGCVQSFFAQKAIEEGNLNLCQLITSTVSRNSCLNSVNLILAGKNQSVSNCKQLQDQSQVIACSNEVYFSLAGTDKANAGKYCNQIANSENLKQTCLTKFAK